MITEKEFLSSMAKLFDRDIARLEQEIFLYSDEESLWKVSGSIINPTGNLCLHLCGNLQHYIGHILGNSDYKRDRDNEFSSKDIPKEKLIGEIRNTRSVVGETLGKLDPELLPREYPVMVFDHPMTTLHFLIHLESHLNYHLGQLNYHRRLLHS